MRLLITTSTYPRWYSDTGASFVLELSQRLSSFFDVYVLCPYTKGSLHYEEINKVKVIRFKYMPNEMESLAYEGGITSNLKKRKINYIQILPFLLMQLISIHRIVKKYKIEVIHAHWIIPQGLVAACYKLFFNGNIKVLATAHGSDLLGLRGIVGTLLKKFTLKHIDSLSVVSNAMACKATEYGYNNPISVFPMGVDTEAFNPSRYDQSLRDRYGVNGALLLFVGRLVENKGVEYLLRAMPSVIAKFPDTKLVIVGNGPIEFSLMELSIDMGIQESIVFAGALPHGDLPKYFATADIYIGPSIVAASGEAEGFGLVCAEAMSSGTPVIMTDLPAFRDMVRDGETGFLISQKDHEQISKRIIMLLQSSCDLEMMKKTARQHIVTNFDWNKVTANYRNLIEGMM